MSTERKVASFDDLHPLAGTSREHGWTIKDETDSLEALEKKRDAVNGAILREKGMEEGAKFILGATDA